MTETDTEKHTGGGDDATRGLEISLVQVIEDDVYEEKGKGADAVFAYANAEATPIDEATDARLLRKIDLWWMYFGGFQEATSGGGGGPRDG
jgi:hypothetical protein